MEKQGGLPLTRCAATALREGNQWRVTANGNHEKTEISNFFVNFALFCGYKTILPQRGAKKREKRKVE
jgi:hypothetical protein